MVVDDSERLWEDLCECEDQLGLIQEEVEDLKAHIKWLEGWVDLLFTVIADNLSWACFQDLWDAYQEGKDAKELHLSGGTTGSKEGKR